ncbi:MAG TPA: hypothetical protein ENO23_10875 [Alphaproteobacteria bacterium]|nr:hypothetical protein [Alphaproteobacteria bacterium]
MLQTDDLFLGGLALLRGAELVGIGVRGTNGRRVAVFRIAGEAAHQAEADYYGGSTVVDLQLLKLQVRRLKDRGFDAIREEERGAGHEGGDRTDQGRERSRGGRR